MNFLYQFSKLLFDVMWSSIGASIDSITVALSFWASSFSMFSVIIRRSMSLDAVALFSITEPKT